MYIEKYCNIVDGYLEFKEDCNKYKFDNIITCNDYMLDQIAKINMVAPSNATVVIFGETGTGKELYAEYIHNASNRCDKKYIKMNCATISESLFESEMFGYEPGAFTGALRDGKKGLFEIATGGTIFLDEISEMTPSIQSKFLRVIQENSFVKVGGDKEINVDVRLVVASNRELSKMVDKGEFREDLFYRLNVIPIKLLPLKQRKEDIILLSLVFMDYFNKSYGLNRQMSSKLMEELLDYDWPGNVRELKNVIERSVLLSSSDLLVNADLKNSIKTKGMEREINFSRVNNYFDMDYYCESGKSLKQIMCDYEKIVIDQYIKKYGSLRKAAKALQISPASISRKISEYENTK